MKSMLYLFIATVLLTVAAHAAENPSKKTDDVKFKEPVVKESTPSEKPNSNSQEKKTSDAPEAPEPTPAKLNPPVPDNSAVLNAWLSGPQEQPCGIACPKCGKEMVLNTKIQLTTVPPAKIIRCQDQEKCKYATAVF